MIVARVVCLRIDIEHTSFHFGLCGRKFVLCLFGQCPDLCTICHSWQHTGVVHLSLQADGKVAFEDIPVFGVCRPACHDSSLYLFVLVLFLEAVVLSQVHVAWDMFYQHIVSVYRGVVYNHHPDLGRFRIRSRNQRTNLNPNPDLIPDSDSCVVESDLESESCRFESESDSDS